MLKGVRGGPRHGMSHSPVYKVWKAMKDRCYNQANPWYASYGGRGICVCVEWMSDFPRFMADMGPRPDGLTLERRDNDGDYTSENCVWATKMRQARNRRTNKLITLGGVTHSLTEWCEINGIRPGVAFNRLHAYHWSEEDAVTVPLFARTRWFTQEMET